MSLAPPTEKLLFPSHKAIINATTQLQSENLQYLKKAKNLLARKNVIKSDIVLRVRNRKMEPLNTKNYNKVNKKNFLTPPLQMPTTSLLSNCYSYQQDYNYPITMNECQHLQIPLLTVVPVVTPTSIPLYITPVLGNVVQPILSPVLGQTFVRDDMANIFNYTNGYYPTEQFNNLAEDLSEQTCQIQEIDVNTDTDTANTKDGVQEKQSDVVESYLNLPKELFPTPSMLTLDPNPVIDEFCKMPNLQRHMPWILDLEFGIPKAPITRPIPTYNVKFNSINCKNAPDAIHPHFESCDPDFKKVLLFYYDCIVSAWYRGYMIFNCDTSVENFQSWLLRPMQVLGMCWP